MDIIVFRFSSGMRGYISRYMFSAENLCGQVTGVGPFGVLNSHSGTQTVEGGRCVHEQRHAGMTESRILR